MTYSFKNTSVLQSGNKICQGLLPMLAKLASTPWSCMPRLISKKLPQVFAGIVT